MSVIMVIIVLCYFNYCNVITALKIFAKLPVQKNTPSSELFCNEKLNSLSDRERCSLVMLKD